MSCCTKNLAPELLTSDLDILKSLKTFLIESKRLNFNYVNYYYFAALKYMSKLFTKKKTQTDVECFGVHNAI